MKGFIMSVSATNYSNNLNFRGKYKTSENGTNYYHTNSAMKIGGTLAGITGISSAVNYFQNKGFHKHQGVVPKDGYCLLT